MKKIILLISVLAYSTISCVARRWENDHSCQPSDGTCCETQCPAGWRGFQGQCYLISQEPMTWPNGQGWCETSSAGSYLLDVNGNTESNWIKAQIAYSGFCESGETMSSEGTICYSLSPGNLNQADAKQFCENNGKQLADMPDSSVLNDIISFYPNEALNGLWIAIKYDTTAGEWQDFNGNPQTYLPWNSDGSQPDNPSTQSCVLVNNNLLHDAACGSANWPALCSGPVNHETWIGATDVDVESEFRSVSSGEDLSYNEFPASLPADESKNCAAYDTPENGDWGWNSFACSSKKLVICEKDADCFIR